ncbi:hypothetical protein C1Y26_30525 [Pseudomonas sp. MPR-R2A7]|nr:hypothetical protein C1Y23_29865 [Pseudomonas sp. GW460-12]PMX29786.1 hypothetical protein C1Y24_31710 [Pseudomonas sp. MPR-R2A4]PMX33595.1 hypothetical protein C1Y26_30525 [Pseudomonas sp. MPR-R2A7]PMX51729.1 hypothetical protein C1Y17_22720 [Pseudomonas sp. MPR-R2A6]PMX82481.1 hypothetical protein C1Y21_31125 [Pseudomonas sp. MPR-R2A3]PMY05701.1 hypothetical protein C1Y22_30895 [Pseudomonas sp. MPR-R2A5]PNA22001.1 hypothetical protein C1Y16_31310 [Pseudomonas sp. MPR-ANB1]PNA42654.1 hyp
MLAKDVSDNACILDECGVLEFFASKLAPTGGCGVFRGSAATWPAPVHSGSGWRAVRWRR